jgi:hypothetical protein
MLSLLMTIVVGSIHEEPGPVAAGVPAGIGSLPVLPRGYT